MSKRSYHQLCGVAKALDVVGERWTLLIVRNLLVGGLRYKDLLDTLPGITTNLLADRLKEMIAADLLVQRELSAPSGSVVYELTQAGRELEPVVLALGRFGARYLSSPKRGDLSNVRWAMVSLLRRYRGSKARGVLVFEVGGPAQRYVLQLSEHGLTITQGDSVHADARVSMNPETFRSLLFTDASARTLVARGEIELSGDRSLFHALLSAIG